MKYFILGVISCIVFLSLLSLALADNVQLYIDINNLTIYQNTSSDPGSGGIGSYACINPDNHLNLSEEIESYIFQDGYKRLFNYYSLTNINNMITDANLPKLLKSSHIKIDNTLYPYKQYILSPNVAINYGKLANNITDFFLDFSSPNSSYKLVLDFPDGFDINKTSMFKYTPIEFFNRNYSIAGGDQYVILYHVPLHGTISIGETKIFDANNIIYVFDNLFCSNESETPFNLNCSLTIKTFNKLQVINTTSNWSDYQCHVYYNISLNQINQLKSNLSANMSFNQFMLNGSNYTILCNLTNYYGINDHLWWQTIEISGPWAGASVPDYHLDHWDYIWISPVSENTINATNFSFVVVDDFIGMNANEPVYRYFSRINGTKVNVYSNSNRLNRIEIEVTPSMLSTPVNKMAIYNSLVDPITSSFRFEYTDINTSLCSPLRYVYYLSVTPDNSIKAKLVHGNTSVEVNVLEKQPNKDKYWVGWNGRPIHVRGGSLENAEPIFEGEYFLINGVMYKLYNISENSSSINVLNINSGQIETYSFGTNMSGEIQHHSFKVTFRMGSSFIQVANISNNWGYLQLPVISVDNPINLSEANVSIKITSRYPQGYHTIDLIVPINEQNQLVKFGSIYFIEYNMYGDIVQSDFQLISDNTTNQEYGITQFGNYIFHDSQNNIVVFNVAPDAMYHTVAIASLRDNNLDYSTQLQSYICSPSWSCSNWSSCINNIQTRTCTDLNFCNVNNTETQSCSSSPSNTRIGSYSSSGGGFITPSVKANATNTSNISSESEIPLNNSNIILLEDMTKMNKGNPQDKNLDEFNQPLKQTNQITGAVFGGGNLQGNKYILTLIILCIGTAIFLSIIRIKSIYKKEPI